jgi:hypothetical protein
MNTRLSDDELRDLIDVACRGAIDEKQQVALDVILAESEPARQLYADYFQLHTELYWLIGRSRDSGALSQEDGHLQHPPCEAELASSHRSESESPVSIPANPSPFPISAPLSSLPTTLFASGWPVAYLVATVIFGIGLLVGALIHVSHSPQVADQLHPRSSPLDTRPSPGMNFVGRITAMVDCQWADKSEAAINGAHVPLGRKYALSSGFMEITYDSGAKVLLQGPVTYEVESSAGGYLSVGKLTAKLEQKSEVRGQRSESANQKSEIRNHQFAVRTPTATVADLGTEFGVEVQASGATATHVYRGIVEVRPATEGAVSSGQAVRLAENESLRVEKQADGVHLAVHRDPVDPSAFVRVEQLPKLVEEKRLKPFRRWQAYSRELRRDPSLLAYYDFQQKPGAPAVLANVAANGDRSLDGLIENARWATGRMPGKQALVFNGVDDNVRFNLPKTTESLTLSAWVYVNSINEGPSALVASEDWGKRGQLHWLLCPDGRVVCDVYGLKPRNQRVHVEADGALESHAFRNWVHLAVVFDHAAGVVHFYRDRRLMKSVDVEPDILDNGDKKAAPQKPFLRLGPARIGLWRHGTWPDDNGPRNFQGRIDELAVFGRALTADELDRIVESGRPKNEPDAGAASSTE